MKNPALTTLLVILLVIGQANTLQAQNTACVQFRAKVPDLAALMKMTKAERDDLKTFVIANEADLKKCLGDRVDRLKAFLK